MRKKKGFEGPDKIWFCEVLVEESSKNGERFEVAVGFCRLPREK